MYINILKMNIPYTRTVTKSFIKCMSSTSLNKYKPSDFQKRILLWTKKYKSREEIPQYVSADLIDRSRSEFRIKIANLLMLLTALGSFGAILLGKAAAKRGDSVQKQNQDWHQQYVEDYNRKNNIVKTEGK